MLMQLYYILIFATKSIENFLTSQKLQKEQVTVILQGYRII